MKWFQLSFLNEYRKQNGHSLFNNFYLYPYRYICITSTHFLCNHEVRVCSAPYYSLLVCIVYAPLVNWLRRVALVTVPVLDKHGVGAPDHGLYGPLDVINLRLQILHFLSSLHDGQHRQNRAVLEQILYLYTNMASDIQAAGLV